MKWIIQAILVTLLSLATVAGFIILNNLATKEMNQACIKLGYEEQYTMNDDNYCIKNNIAQLVKLDCDGTFKINCTAKPLVKGVYLTKEVS